MHNNYETGEEITNKLRGGGGSLTKSSVTRVLIVLELYEKYQIIAFAMC